MWMHFGIKDLIDVLLVAVFLYQTYKIMKSSGISDFRDAFIGSNLG